MSDEILNKNIEDEVFATELQTLGKDIEVASITMELEDVAERAKKILSEFEKINTQREIEKQNKSKEEDTESKTPLFFLLGLTGAALIGGFFILKKLKNSVNTPVQG
jgi:LPXTG-motif cell wall-anchored protein